MNNKAITLAVLLGCMFFAVSTQAATITVTTNSPDWQFISQNTFGLPADLSSSSTACGIENETTCEPTGVFNFNVAFNLSSFGVFNLVDADGTLSDTIKVFNDATTGLGVLSFNSDPATQTLGTTLGTEVTCPNGLVFVCPTPGGTNNQGGVIATLTILDMAGDTITAKLASDSEVAFDPFGLGADSSDEVQFSGNVTVIPPVPEPSSLLLVGTGLISLLGSKKWRLLL